MKQIKNIFQYFYHQYFKPKIFLPKSSYSMYGEDIIISNFFKNKSNGFYVDVGCYHPLEGSNTYLLYKKKWRGINIDVNPLSVELFDFSRKDDLNINLAISDKKSKIKLYFRKKINMLNTVSKKLAKIHFLNGFQEKTVKADTLNSVLKKSKFNNQSIDFLNLDIEGNELIALKSLDFKKYKPKLICVEIHNHEEMYNHRSDYLVRNPTYKFLMKKNYKVLWSKKFSYIFKKIKI
ncbi:MAG: Methyltransferase FkbM domain-containing protein [Pelagibacterales bacterium]|nr:Methyltransferase FkbM domain-containing protein [Pelagibacterales bacterium]